MRIKFDERNKAVIAEGYVSGRKVRAISVCSADDTYDKEFGSELVLAKYKYREALAKIKCHETAIKNARAEIARLMAVVENEKNIIKGLDLKAVKFNDKANEIIENKYNK